MSSIIINEFEIMPATGPDAAGEPSVAEAQQADNPPAESPVLEVERVLRYQALRQQRLWAH